MGLGPTPEASQEGQPLARTTDAEGLNPIFGAVLGKCLCHIDDRVKKKKVQIVAPSVGEMQRQIRSPSEVIFEMIEIPGTHASAWRGELHSHAKPIPARAPGLCARRLRICSARCVRPWKPSAELPWPGAHWQHCIAFSTRVSTLPPSARTIEYIDIPSCTSAACVHRQGHMWP